MLRKFSVRVPNNRDTVHNIPIELESDINNSNTLFRISGPYQLFTLNTDAHTHTARRWRRRYILATIYSQRNTIHFGINGTININTNRKTAIRCSYLFGSCVICSKRWATHSNISLSLSLKHTPNLSHGIFNRKPHRPAMNIQSEVLRLIKAQVWHTFWQMNGKTRRRMRKNGSDDACIVNAGKRVETKPKKGSTNYLPD